MKFSIITPSYRQLDWLKLCVASVADQTSSFSHSIFKIEHLIQDGGTEGIEEFFEKIAVEKNGVNKNYEIRLFKEADQGMYDAVNRGLRRATGDICAYINCDEQYLPETLNKVAVFFERHPEIDVLFGDVILVDRVGKPLSYRRTTLPLFSHVQLSTLNILTCATFFRRKLIEENHFFSAHLKVAGDQAWIYALLKAKVKMVVLPEPLSIFTFTQNNLSETSIARDERTGWLPERKHFPAWKETLAVIHHRIRKGIAGAYKRRNVSIKIYTLDSADRRKQIKANQVGFGWPRGNKVS